MTVLNGLHRKNTVPEFGSGIDPKEEKRLIDKAKSGDASAFGSLYDILKFDMYRYALYVTGTREDAEDAVQEALIIAWKNISDLKSNEKFKAWIFKILRNECMGVLRKNSKNGETVCFEECENTFSDLNDGFSSTGSDLISIVRSLPPPDGQMILMSVIGGFNSNELSKMFLMTPNTVRTRMSRAMKKLRIMLSEEGN